MVLEFRQVRLRIRALTAGRIDDALVERVTLTRLTALWQSWDWSWREAHDVIATVAPHSEGHATVNSNATLVQGVGTAWTSNDVGSEIIVGNSNAHYTITAV